MIKLLREFIMGLSGNPGVKFRRSAPLPADYGRDELKSRQYFGDSPASGNEL